MTTLPQGFTPANVVALLTLPVLGWVAHEIAHYVAARVLGCPATLSLFPPRVGFDTDAVWKTRVVRLAPAAAGAAVGGGYLLVFGWPALTPLSVGLMAGLLLMSRPSGTDWLAIGLDLEALSAAEVELLRTGGIYVVLFAIYASPYVPSGGLIHEGYVLLMLLVVGGQALITGRAIQASG